MSRWLAATMLAGLALAAVPGLAQSADKAQTTSSKDCEAKNLPALANWGGVWIAEDLRTGINGRSLPGAPDLAVNIRLAGLVFAQAPWNAEGWSRVEKTLHEANRDHPLQAGWAFPVMMDAPAPFTIVVAPAETVIVSQYREIRYIFTDGRPHTPDDQLWPTLWGDSIGCWDGDTLVIDTIDAHYDYSFNYFAPPLSDNAHFVERLRLTAPDRLESDITVTDPETLTGPWKVRVVYMRHPVLKRLTHEGEMFAGNRTVEENGQESIAPPQDETAPAEKPMRAAATLTADQLDRVAGKYQMDGQPTILTVKREKDFLLIRADPGQPFFLPIRPSDPLNYFSRIRNQQSIHFVTDAKGQVTGLTGTSIDGSSFAAKRMAGIIRASATD